MGNRATVFVEDERGELAPCGMYVHWRGESILDILKCAIPGMRKGDVCYSMARLIGYAHGAIDGNLGLGVVSAPRKNSAQAFKRHSPGDAGVVVYNCFTGSVRLFDSYLTAKFGDEFTFDVPPAA